MGTMYQSGKKGLWWIRFYRNGKPFYENTRSPRKKDAQRLLALREGQVASGIFTGLRTERVRFEELQEDLLTEQRVNGRRTVRWTERKVARLASFFAGRRAVDITTADVNTYIAQRQQEGAAPATINRELATLKRMFNLAIRAGKQYHKPYIPMLQENNVRTGFFGEVEFLALHEALPDYLRPLVTFAYTTGWRHAEVVGLTWDRVDLAKGIVRLDPGTTKNREGRTVVLTERLRQILTAQWERTRALVAQRHPDPTPREVAAAVPRVFWHQNGQPLRDFRKAWAAACAEAKVPGRLFHDLRRTAVRNMVRAGVPERVAMAISGHKTRSVFDRYNIVAETDLHEAAQRMGSYLEGAGSVPSVVDSQAEA